MIKKRILVWVIKKTEAFSNFLKSYMPKYGDILISKYSQIPSVIDSFTMAEEAISYCLHLSSLILNGNIISADFKKVQGLPQYIKAIDWEKNPEGFREQAESIPFSAFSCWVVICGQGYFDLTDGKTIDPEVNPDLHSAQMILRLIRNSFGHPAVGDSKTIIKWNVREKIYRKKYEIKSLGIVLDARKLNGKEFKLADLGGWPNIFKIFDFLIEDLNTRISTAS